jgi:biotin operon repressor
MEAFKKSLYETNFFRFDKEIVHSKAWAALPAASKSVYPVIASHCNAEGVSFPSQQRIALLSGLSEKTVRVGLSGLKVLAGMSIEKKMVRGRLVNNYKIRPTPDIKGRSFTVYNVIIRNGLWARLKQSSHALYITLRTFSFFDPLLYFDLEGLEDYGYDVASFIEDGNYRTRKYDFAYPEIKYLSEYAGISRSAIFTALTDLETWGIIDKTESIDGYRAWKLYLIPDEAVKPISPPRRSTISTFAPSSDRSDWSPSENQMQLGEHPPPGGIFSLQLSNFPKLVQYLPPKYLISKN